MKTNAFFGSAALGTSLHQALAQVYQDWCYSEPLPPLSWLHYCWEQHCNNLSPIQVEEGKQILQTYYQNFIAIERAIHKPLAVEGKIQASLQVANLEFAIAGRYDRLDYLDDGLELIDYKSTKEVKLSSSFFCHPSRSKIDSQTFYFPARAWLSRVLPLLLLALSMITAIATKTCLQMCEILKHSSSSI